MKMNTSLLTTLSFLLLPLLVHSNNSPHLIDHTGSKVRSTSHYHIISAIRGGGSGGLGLHAGRHQRCPLDVIQLSSNNNHLQKGMILRFSPADNSGFIRESTDLNVKFSTTGKGACQQPTVWKVDDYDESRGKWFITTGGIEGNPGAKTLRNWFRLEKTAGSNSDTYKMVHCPSVCPSCARICYNIGISNDDNGAQRLALVPDNEPALHVRLMPAGERSVSSVYDSR